MLILTFDIEDWFHTHQNRNLYSGHIWDTLPSGIQKNTDRILDLLEKTGHKATFFILGWVVKLHPGLIRKISRAGHELAAHSNWHHNPNLLNPEDFEKDLILCKNRIEDVSGVKIAIYRAPGFSLGLKDEWAFDILIKNGIEIDSSIKLKRNKDVHGPFVIKTSSSQIIEFPLMAMASGFSWSGGGYFRALPESFIDNVFKQDEYNLIYLHPRDMDNKNPVTNMFSLYRNLLNSYNTGKCTKKLIRLLSNHHCYNIGEYVSTFGSTNLKIVATNGN